MKHLFIFLILSFFVVSNFAEEKKDNSLRKTFIKAYHSFKEKKDEASFKNALEIVNKMKNTPDDKVYAIAMESYLYKIWSDVLLDEVVSQVDNAKIRDKFFIANLLLDKGEYEKAIKIYEEINKENPKWTCPWRHKGEAYYKMNDYVNAESAFLKSIEVQSKHTDAYLWLAKAQMKLGKYSEALASLDKGLELVKKYQEKEEEVFPEDFYKVKIEIFELMNMLDSVKFYQDKLNSK